MTSIAREDRNAIHPLVRPLAAMFAGAIEATVLQPLDVLKTRVQLDKVGKYQGIIHSVKKIRQEEGVRALYKGLVPFQLNLMLKYLYRFACYEQMKRIIGADKHGESNLLGNIAAGAVAGVTEAILIVTPCEVVKIRLQQQSSFANQSLKYTGPWNCLSTIVRTEGVQALWSGVIPTMIRNGTNAASNFAVMYAVNRYVWNKRQGDGVDISAWKTFITGVCGGAIGPFLNCPFDVAKTRVQAQEKLKADLSGTAKYRGLIHTIRTVFVEEGFKALYKGLFLRVARVAPGQGISWVVMTGINTYCEKMVN